MDHFFDLRKKVPPFIDPKDLRISLDPFENVVLDLPAKLTYKRVTVRLAFPITAPNQFIVFKGYCGKDLGILRCVFDLEPISRGILLRELDRAYFRPTIVKVNCIRMDSAVPIWDVETDRGHRIFEAENNSLDLREFDSGRILIIDVDRNQYEIQDYRKLDRRSRIIVGSQI